MSDMLNEDDIRGMIRQEITKELGSNDTKKVKKEKKKPSKWNLFLKERCSIDKSDVPMAERAKLCSEEYKKVKDKLVIDEDGLHDIE